MSPRLVQSMGEGSKALNETGLRRRHRNAEGRGGREGRRRPAGTLEHPHNPGRVPASCRAARPSSCGEGGRADLRGRRIRPELTTSTPEAQEARCHDGSPPAFCFSDRQVEFHADLAAPAVRSRTVPHPVGRHDRRPPPKRDISDSVCFDRQHPAASCVRPAQVLLDLRRQAPDTFTLPPNHRVRFGVTLTRTSVPNLEPTRSDKKATVAGTWEFSAALGGIRTPNLLIRSQMLYPLGYERKTLASDQRFCHR